MHPSHTAKNAVLGLLSKDIPTAIIQTIGNMAAFSNRWKKCEQLPCTDTPLKYMLRNGGGCKRSPSSTKFLKGIPNGDDATIVVTDTNDESLFTLQTPLRMRDGIAWWDDQRIIYSHNKKISIQNIVTGETEHEFDQSHSLRPFFVWNNKLVQYSDRNSGLLQATSVSKGTQQLSITLPSFSEAKWVRALNEDTLVYVRLKEMKLFFRRRQRPYYLLGFIPWGRRSTSERSCELPSVPSLCLYDTTMSKKLTLPDFKCTHGVLEVLSPTAIQDFEGSVFRLQPEGGRELLTLLDQMHNDEHQRLLTLAASGEISYEIASEFNKRGIQS